MASSSAGTDTLTEKAVRHYSRSLWRDPFFCHRGESRSWCVGAGLQKAHSVIYLCHTTRRYCDLGDWYIVLVLLFATTLQH